MRREIVFASISRPFPTPFTPEVRVMDDMCATCHAGCCRSFAVPVTGADIIRIEQEKGLDFWDFVCRWTDPDSKIARNHAPHFFFADEPETPFVISLMHEKSQTFPETTRCEFLVETAPDQHHPLGTGRCAIYEDRPAACRAFPTKLNQTGQLAVIYDVPSHGRPGNAPLYQLCPRPWQPGDFNPIKTVQDLVVGRYEMDFFHELANSWNQTNGEWELFPDFLRLVYASRVIPDPASAGHAKPGRENRARAA